jgi:hypothetical protein
MYLFHNKNKMGEKQNESYEYENLEQYNGRNKKRMN